ncbi:MAG: restriction endonuclease [Acidobacteria bacterium]|nr:restriction endonuclease [Acidobacteriota bacterium]
MSWLIAEVSDDLGLFVESDGVWLRSKTGVFDIRQLRSSTSKNRLGRLLPTLIPQLLELGLATEERGGIRIEHGDFALLETQHRIDAFEGVVPWAPFAIEIETTGWPGGESFRYYYRFYSGSQVVNLERLGCFVRRHEAIFRFDPQTFSLVEAIDAFNSLAPEVKASREAFVRFAEVKDLAEGVGAQLDAFLGRERVIVPSRVGLDLIVEDGGRISFAPKIDGAPRDAMREAFLASEDVDEVYSLDDSEGGRVRVVLDETQREVLRRMQRVRHLAGVEKAEVLRDPHRVFDGVASAVEIDLGPRVRGVGDFPFAAHPYLQRSSTGIFEDAESNRGVRGKFDAGLKCQYSDGTAEDVPFTSREQLLRFRQAAEEAKRVGRGSVDFDGKSIIVDDSLLKGLDELVGRVTPAKTEDSGKTPTPRKYLLIYTNENELEYEEAEEITSEETRTTLPRSLNKGVLKDYQLAGFAWLQRIFRLQRRGCLLADDMGLGKTLQVLVFLAWLIEKGELGIGSANPEAAPWDPILIVTPVTLLENETWIEDMRKFFVDQGEVFRPWITLHGTRLRDFRREGVEGQETVIGEAVLDLDRLRQHRVVLTNYETVVNYQHSFARMKKQWSVVITDEAQEYKTPNTKISHALKSLAPGFRIACTGTPVETRLMDIWNIFDFLQPGKLLGSAAEFRDRYEKPVECEASATGSSVLPQLKERLQLNRPNAFVLRREKTRLPELPSKQEHVISCELSPKQRQWHLDIVGRARAGGEGNHPLSLLQQLMKVYEHPALVPRYEPLQPMDAVQQCPKLAEVVQCLRNVRKRGEKALIFTRSIYMQGILAAVVGAEFDLDVEIINGATPRHGDTGRARQTRRSIVKRFRESAGFNVIVLSPDVAGVGLTLIEANHVIHYGRWWNPAKEAQATDRVYRIGQTRNVHVYYLIAKDPQGAFETFDEKLDALVRRRRELASEFLTPMPSEEDLELELLRNILEAPGDSTAARTLTKDDVRLLPWDRFEALIGVLEEKRGFRIVLTQHGGDDKADVLAVGHDQMRVVQCKHSIWGASVDADVLAEVVGAIEIYRARYLRGIPRTVTLRPIVVTNGMFTAKARAEARARDVELVGDPDLWRLLEETPCTPAEVENVEQRRLASMRDVQAAIKSLVS